MTGVEGASASDIAIVGIGVRMPGVESIDELWQLLADEQCVVGHAPPGRGGPGENLAGVRGGFVETADAFDASFFEISAREATYMDPQQRFALELAWNAIEDAGYAATTLSGSNTGVFMGVANSDYTELVEMNPSKTDPYVPTGTSAAMIANRISHWFGFHGPSLALDTACASSLTAVHQAVRAIESGDCDQALAGAVNICWSARRFQALTRNGMLASGGLCRAFDHNADGYVRSEGGAVVLLKPLATALADRDAVHAVIRGVASNHGGRTNSLTITNPHAHAKLISDLYTRAGVDPRSVSYIETHGPGTPLGDPIEIHGLKTAFDLLSKGQQVDAPFCGLGSVKTNLGHMESAAGLAGILKVVAAMHHNMLPASLHFESLNPMITLEGSPFYIVERATPWKPSRTVDETAAPRRAGVSSFGFGGSNAHVLLEEPPAFNSPTQTPACATPCPDRVALIAARNDTELRETGLRLLDYLSTPPDTSPELLRDLTYTLQVGRTAFPHRAAFVASTIDELATTLSAFTSGQSTSARHWANETSPDLSGMALLADDEDVETMVRNWLAKGKVDRLAQLWTLGWSIDWQILYADTEIPRRVHLPTYPFARKRFWLPDDPGEDDTVVRSDTAGAAGPPVRAPHPTSASNQRAPKRIQLAELPKPDGVVDDVCTQPSSVQRPATASGPPGQTGLDPACRDLRHSLARLLFTSPDEVNDDAPFTDLGLDSVLIVEWVRELNARFGTSLTASQVYDYPSVRALATYLLGETDLTGCSKAEGTTHSQQRAQSTPQEPMVEQLRVSLAEVLFLDDDDIAPDAKFIDLGMDSVLAHEWVRLINTRFGVDLPAVVVYDHPTLLELADRLAVAPSKDAGSPGDDLHLLLQQVSSGELDIDAAEQLYQLVSSPVTHS